eukprot:536628-Alexandrium_andersonii.AAC.2
MDCFSQSQNTHTGGRCCSRHRDIGAPHLLLTPAHRHSAARAGRRVCSPGSARLRGLPGSNEATGTLRTGCTRTGSRTGRGCCAGGPLRGVGCHSLGSGR